MRWSSIVANVKPILLIERSHESFGSDMHDARTAQREKYGFIKLLNLNTKGKFIADFETSVLTEQSKKRMPTNLHLVKKVD